MRTVLASELSFEMTRSQPRRSSEAYAAGWSGRRAGQGVEPRRVDRVPAQGLGDPGEVADEGVDAGLRVEAGDGLEGLLAPAHADKPGMH
jgi:hypothetical protein